MKTFTGLILIITGICVFGILAGNVLKSSSSPSSLSRPAAGRRKPIKKKLPDPEIDNILKNIDSQIIEGFHSIKSASASGMRPSRSGTVQSWWAYSNNPEQKVVWLSAICPGKEKSTLVFSGVLGMGKGKAALLVNGISALTFSVGPGPEEESWENAPYFMTFLATKVHPSGERFGLFILTIPEKVVHAGRPIQLEVRGIAGQGRDKSYFMLSGIQQSLPEHK